MTSRSFGHRAPLLWIVLPMIGGLALGRVAGIEHVGPILAGALAAAVIAALSGWRNHPAWAPAILVAMVLAGIASHALHRARLPVWDALPPREARLSLAVDRVFAQTDPKRASGLAQVVAADPHLRDLLGQRVFFSVSRRATDPQPLRGATIGAIGVLVALPRNPAPDSFDDYLCSAGINFRLTRGRILAVERPPGPYRLFCARTEAKFGAILGLGIGEKNPELARVLRAMMLGQKHELSDEQDTLFMRSGTMHLFAISGLHIGLIALAIHALLSLLRLPRLARFGLGVAALWLYVDITGATPSAVRAFIMVALVECSLIWRVPGNPVSALAASALIVLVAWPLQVFSASFQLSYGIVAALLLLGLPMADAWLARFPSFPDLPRAAWRWHHRARDAARRKLAPALAIGIASTLVSTFATVRFFQMFTPAALLANLILIPAASVVMWAGLASLLCGLAGATALSAFFNHAAALVLWGMDHGIRAIVELPGAWQPARYAVAWLGPAALIALLLTFLSGYGANWRHERGGWWPPFALFALVLLFGVNFG